MLNLFIVMLLISMGYVSAQLYLPSLPFITADLHTINAHTKLTVTSYFIGSAITTLFVGPLSDALGRRRPLILGTIIAFFGVAFCSLASDISTLIMGRFIQGLGTGSAIAIARPILRDLYSGKNLAKVTGQITGITIGSMSLAPMFGGYLQHYFGWRSSFVAIGLYLFIILIVVTIFLPETNQSPSRHHLRKSQIKINLKRLLSSQHYLFGLSCQMSAFACIVAWQTGGSIIFQHGIGLSPVQFGWLAVSVSLSYMVGSLVNSRLLEYVSITRLMRFGLLLGAVAGLLLLMAGVTHVQTLWSEGIPMLLFTFSVGFVMANSLAFAFEEFHDISGFANSLYTSGQILAAAASSIIISYSADTSPIPVGVMMLLCSLLCLLLKLRLAHE